MILCRTIVGILRDRESLPRAQSRLFAEMSQIAVDRLDLRSPELQERFDVELQRSGRKHRPYNLVGSYEAFLRLRDHITPLWRWASSEDIDALNRALDRIERALDNEKEKRHG